MIIDNQRNGLETQAKAIMLLMLHLWYGLIRFTLELCNFTLNVFQDFVFTYILSKNGNVYGTNDF